MKNLMKQLSALLVIFSALGCKEKSSVDFDIASSTTVPTMQRAQDILPDDQNSVRVFLGDKQVIGRKGTLAAAFANARVLKNPMSTNENKERAWLWFKENALVIAALVGEEVRFTDARIEELLENERKQAFKSKR